MGQLMDTAFTMLRAMKVPFVILMPIYAGIYQLRLCLDPSPEALHPAPGRTWTLAGRTLDGYEPERVDTAKARDLVAPGLRQKHGTVPRICGTGSAGVGQSPHHSRPGKF